MHASSGLHGTINSAIRSHCPARAPLKRGRLCSVALTDSEKKRKESEGIERESKGNHSICRHRVLAISGRSGISVRSMLTRSDSAVSSLQSRSLRSSSSGGLNCANSCLVTTFRLEKITRTSWGVTRAKLEHIAIRKGKSSGCGWLQARTHTRPHQS